MPTLAELETELGLSAGTLTGKPEVAAKWNGLLNDGETKSADAARKLQEAKDLQATIDDQIAKFGVTESTVTGLSVQVAALKAAQAELEKNGVKLDLKIPDLKPPVDPNEQFRQNVVNGFTQIGQTMQVQNRYWQVFGKPMPDDPTKLADEAAVARMSVADFAERKYGFSSELQKKADADLQAKINAGIEAGVKQYKEAHPSNAGHPELHGGGPSNYPAMPKPRDTKDLRSFSQLPARRKIQDAMERANQAAKSAA